jgi:hypothetical protein
MSTLTYAAKASCISNKPVRNEDPKSKVIEEMKKQNNILIHELKKANEHINLLSQFSGEKLEVFGTSSMKKTFYDKFNMTHSTNIS